MSTITHSSSCTSLFLFLITSFLFFIVSQLSLYVSAWLLSPKKKKKIAPRLFLGFIILLQKDDNLSNDISETEKITKLTEGINKLEKVLKNQVLEMISKFAFSCDMGWQIGSYFCKRFYRVFYQELKHCVLYYKLFQTNEFLATCLV